MNSEWIEKLRAAAAMCQSQDDELDYKYWAAVAFDMLPKAVVYIDQQATSLDEAEALTKRNVELINGYLAQITTLQEIAIEERAKRLYKGKFRSLNFELPADRKTHIDEARRQLAKEHPEVDWK